MKIVQSNKYLLLVVVFGWCASLQATFFYQGPSLKLTSVGEVPSWATKFQVNGRFGQTAQAYDGNEKIVDLFAMEGPFNITQIIPYDPTIAGGVATSGVLNSAAATPTGAGLTYVTNAYAIQQGGNRISKNSAPFSFGGKFQEEELTFDFEQNLMYGFFVGMTVPFKQLSLTDITYSTTILPSESRYTSLQNLIEYDLDPMLAQAGIAPLKSPFYSTGPGDLMLYVGWQGRNNTESEFVKYIHGSLRGAVSIPTGAVKDINRVFALPMGANGHYGMHARGNLEFGLFKHLALGGSLAASVYLRQTMMRRLKTDITQNGWILLEKANVLEDLGHSWEATAFVKVYAKYLSGIAGFSLAQQEPSSLKIDAADNLNKLFKHEIMNSDSRLTGFNHQTVHLLLRSDISEICAHPAAPLFELSYDFPLGGKHVFKSAFTGGRVGLMAHWNF